MDKVLSIDPKLKERMLRPELGTVAEVLIVLGWLVIANAAIAFLMPISDEMRSLIRQTGSFLLYDKAVHALWSTIYGTIVIAFGVLIQCLARFEAHFIPQPELAPAPDTFNADPLN